jgi:hypothetical protein
MEKVGSPTTSPFLSPSVGPATGITEGYRFIMHKVSRIQA